MCGNVLSSRVIKKTRKSHRCFGCGRRIPKGTMANYTVSVDYGDLGADYMCLDCNEFQHTKRAREEYVEDDGCVWPDSFRDEPYARFPILEPVGKK